jgi:hypothetical protein
MAEGPRTFKRRMHRSGHRPAAMRREDAFAVCAESRYPFVFHRPERQGPVETSVTASEIHTRSLRAASVRNFAVAAICVTVAVVGTAQELSLLGGALRSGGESTYSWEGSYRSGLGTYAAWSFSWLNEGHLDDHHRDGQTLQVWARLPLAERRWELSAGAGPYRYFDTVTGRADGAYINAHGWGAVLSLRGAYYFDNRWIAQVQLNRVMANGGPDTTALLVGVGYQLDGPDRPGPREYPVLRDSNVTSNELTLLLGATIQNSDKSESSPAEALEFRHGLGSHVDVSGSLIHESGQFQARRDGIAAQIWATSAFFDDRFALSAGVGPYVAITQDNLPADRTGDGRVSALVSVSASYKFGKRWLARVTWNRFATRYDHDADLIQAGLGVRF